MLTIKATHTSLWRLCREYFPNVPCRRYTTFVKLSLQPAYLLSYRDEQGFLYRLHFSVCCGRAFLVDDLCPSWAPHDVPLETLSRLGMLDMRRVSA